MRHVCPMTRGAASENGSHVPDAGPAVHRGPRTHRHRLVVRPVLLEDRPVIEDLLRDSEAPGVEAWIDSMWDRWLRGAGSLLAVAEAEARVCGLSVTTLVSPSETYLHCFRARPRHYFLVAHHRLFLFGIAWALKRRRSVARWAINRERFGRFEAGLIELFRGSVCPAGSFGYWAATPLPGVDYRLLPHERDRELADLWASRDRSRTLWAPYWYWRRLTWADVMRELRLDHVLHDGDGHAIFILAPHGPYLLWAEGPPDQLVACARMFRGYAAARGEKPRALLPDTPEVAAALACAGFVQRATYGIHETTLTPDTLLTFGRVLS